jgi:hypothetical protein
MAVNQLAELLVDARGKVMVRLPFKLLLMAAMLLLAGFDLTERQASRADRTEDGAIPGQVISIVHTKTVRHGGTLTSR